MKQLIQKYYESFNNGDINGMLNCLHPEFCHDVNEGVRRDGHKLFREFLIHMNNCYKENLTDLVVCTNEELGRASAEFVIHGTYLKTDGDLPEARGQKYKLPAGAFFEIKDGKIKRVTTYYNLKEWIRQVSL